MVRAEQQDARSRPRSLNAIFQAPPVSCVCVCVAWRKETLMLLLSCVYVCVCVAWRRETLVPPSSCGVSHGE